MVLWTNPLIFWQLKTPKKIHWSKKNQKKKQHIPKNVPRTGKVIIAWQASIRCNHRNATHPFWMTVDLHGTMAWGKDIFIKWMLGKSSTNHDVPRKNHWTCTMLDIYTLLSMKRQSWMFWHVNVPWKTNPLKIICTNDMKWSNDSKKKRCIPRIHRVTMTTGYHCFQLLSLEVPFCFTKINDIWWVYQMIPQGGAP